MSASPLNGFALLPDRPRLILNDAPKVVTVGRVKRAENSANGGMEDAAWYNFVDFECQKSFYGKNAC
jgi:hypothetical protein